MAQPTQYTRQYNFNDFQTTSPADPLPGVQVDNELNAAKTNLDGLNANIAKIQRDDGLLANQSVHKNSLDTDVLALIGLSGYTVAGNWSAGNAYTAGTLVNFNDATYLATVAHTSGTVFATDKDAGKWILLANAAINTSASTVDKFEGTGSQTAFTLTYTYTSNTDVLVFVNGALRNPGDDYTISGNTITFSTAPGTPSVSGNENVIIWGPNVTVQSAVTAAQTASSNASGHATAAANSATTATTQAGIATAKAVLTAADVVSTNADVVSTNADVVSTNADAATTTADRAQVNTDKGIVATDKGIVAADKAIVAADKALVLGYKNDAASSATDAQGSEDEAEAWAQKVNGEAVTGEGYSSKAWAVGGTGVSDTAGSGAAKEWAVEQSGTVDGTEYSAKEYAIGTQAANTAGSAKQWAIGGGNSFSTNTVVSGSLYSAKYYAEQAAAAADGFDDTYLGAKSSDPSLDNDGNALATGAIFFLTTTNRLRVYDGASWNDAVVDTTGFATNGFAIAMAIAL